MHSWIKEFCVTMFWGNSHCGVITKQSFLICPKFEGKVASQSWKHCTYIISLWSKFFFESYFRDRLTFSNVDSRTSRRIYRPALLLRAPETLFSLSKSRISIFNAHLTLLVRKMTSHNSIGKYRHLVN